MLMQGPSLLPPSSLYPLSSSAELHPPGLSLKSTIFSFQLQVNLLSKFLLIAKSCYEQRNFATAMQILGGLEHLAVRQSPVRAMGLRGIWAGQVHGATSFSPVLPSQAWRILPAKIAEVMEELKAVEVSKSSLHGLP